MTVLVIYPKTYKHGILLYSQKPPFRDKIQHHALLLLLLPFQSDKLAGEMKCNEDVHSLPSQLIRPVKRHGLLAHAAITSHIFLIQL